MFGETGEGEGGSTVLLVAVVPNIKEKRKKVKKKKTGKGV